MIYPSRTTFKKLARRGNLIPVYRELGADLETPVSAFLKIDTGAYSFLLESVEGQEKIARYSFLGSDPSLIISSKGSLVTLAERRDGRFQRRTYPMRVDPLAEIQGILTRYQFVDVPGLPRFCGGLVGYAGYDCVRFFENIPDRNPDDLNLADMIFMLTDTILIFDHVAHTIKIVVNVHVPDQLQGTRDKYLDRAYERALQRLHALTLRLQKPLRMPRLPAGRAATAVRSNITPARFAAAVRQAKTYIRRGDIIQTVLSQRFQTRSALPAFQLYRALRRVNPSPYMYYLKFGDVKLIGASPEVMVRCEAGIAEVRPIAGTRVRGATKEADQVLARELLADPKERAEHVMLVDLGRNDLGRVCRFGSVKVSELMAVERYSHVMHIVSNVRGELQPDKNVFDLLRATFPAGTVTGAPKIRAMEIIDELETVRRGPYAGCVGYFSFSGNLDACITIRTIVLKGDVAYVQAGAGIVADSDPQREYRETVNKARALLAAINLAQEGML